VAGKRLQGLDGLRGIAALAVVAYHYSDEKIYYGLLGVELFFVISGFVILMTLERVPTVGEFARHRFARLYPAYWLSVLLAAWALSPPISQMLTNLTMLQSFVHEADLIDPYWTLAYELWFYLVMAGLFASGQIKNIERFALLWLGLMFAFRTGMIFGRGNNLYWNWYFHLLAMPQFGHLFIAGMMLYRKASNTGTRLTPICLWFAILYSAFGRPDWAGISPLVYFSVNALSIVAVWNASMAMDLFAWQPLVRIGQRSYSIYLLHVPIWLMMTGEVGTSVTTIVLSIICTLIVSSLSWTFVERPAQAWARRLVSQ
jgi:peptidoglycan/LPS O-acetylase OafA/YrhL